MSEKEINKITDLLNKIKADVARLEKMLEDAEKSDLEQVPGIEGEFDGVYMVTKGGEKYEVPSNYAAKSRILFGDKLKMVEVDGKNRFKQVEKSKKKKIEGIISKKEGKWYILSDSGSYRLSDAAAEFQGVEINDEAIAVIPADNLSVPFAALDKVLKNINNTGSEKSQKDRKDMPKDKDKVSAEPGKDSNKPEQSEKKNENIEEKDKPTNKPESSGTGSSKVGGAKSGSKSVSKSRGKKQKHANIQKNNVPKKETKQEEKTEVSNQEDPSRVLRDDDLR
jgi:hypothetical protein